MAKKESKFLRSLVAVILLAAVLFATLFTCWYFTGGGWFGGAIPSTFTVTVNGEKHSKDVTVGYLYSGTEIEIASLFGEEYTVEIGAAQGTRTTVKAIDGEDTVAWEKLNADFDKGFEIKQTEKGFTLSYVFFEDILSKATERDDLELANEVKKELFVMTVACANAEIRMSFNVGMEIRGLHFDREHYIFNGAKGE